MNRVDPQATNCGFADAFDNLDTDSVIQELTPPTCRPAKQEVEHIARRSGYSSREPKALVKAPEKEQEGQINIRAKQAVLERFREFGKRQEPRWPSGYVLERALEALEREMKKKGQE